MGLRHLGVVLLLGGACTSTSTGAAGADSLIFTSDEPPGTNCPAGGVRVDHGQDLDDNGVLQGDEIKGTGFVCDGPMGNMGGMGTAGRPALIAVTTESPSTNCPNVGGKRIDYGVDDNGNGALDSGEIDGTAYVCNGATGAAGAKSLMAVDNVVAGNCAAGGQRIRYGIDDDGNNTLDTGEVDGTSYVCDGATPTAQINALDARVTTLEGRRLHTANITNGATPVVNSTSDAWISTVTHPAYGSATVNFAGGTFSAAPTCFAQLVSYPGATASGSISVTATSTTSATLSAVCSGSSCTGLWDVTFNLLCVPF